MKKKLNKKLKKTLGFTLIELMITVAIVGILASIAYPSYTSFIVRSNRAEAQRELLRLASLQEQRFVDWRSYSADMTDLGANANPYVTDTGNYSIAGTTANSGGSFILTATAKGTQATNDTACPKLYVNNVGQITPAACWEK